MSEPSPVESPTGTPTLPAPVRSMLPWLAVLVIVAASALGVGLFDGTPYERISTKLLLLVIGLGAALGISSPGTRKAGPLVALVLVASLGLTSCTHLKNIGRATLECSAPALVEQAKDLAPVLLDALLKPSTDWSGEVDRLVLSAGTVGLCAMQALLAELSGAPKMPSNASNASFLVGGRYDLARLRALRWLDANGLAVE